MAASSYEYRKQIEGRKDKYFEERKLITEIFLESDGIYGYRRVAVAANKKNETLNVSERIVGRIMQEEDLKS